MGPTLSYAEPWEEDKDEHEPSVSMMEERERDIVKDLCQRQHLIENVHGDLDAERQQLDTLPEAAKGQEE